MYILSIKSNKRKNNTCFKGKQKDNVNKAKPPLTFSCCCCINLRTKKSKGGIKFAGGGVEVYDVCREQKS
jgi:hypothetical protein